MDKFYAVQIGQLIFGVTLVVVIIAVITGEGHGAAHGDVGENKRAGAHGIVPIALLIRSQFIHSGPVMLTTVVIKVFRATSVVVLKWKSR